MSIATIIEKIIFRPVKLAQDYQFKFDIDFEEFFFHPEIDVMINALHFKSKDSKGVILYFHGNKDNLARWGKIASELTRFSYDVIVVDYRGYGKSTGVRTEEKLYTDALNCYTEIKEKINPQQFIIYGRSLGTGIASWLAEKTNPQGLVLETPYYDMHDLVGNYFPPFLYKNKLNFKFSSFSYLQKTSFPILIIHGTKDEVVPYKSGLKLFESINNPRKIFCSINKGKHNDLNKFDQFWKYLEDFLK